MRFVKVLRSDELQVGEKAKVVVEGKPILVVNLEGQFYAVSDKCPHLGGSLSEGIVEDGKVRCPKHGAMFDLKTGENLNDAKVAFLKMKVKDVSTFPIKVEGEDLLIGLDE